jgi:glycosyltransferase involved in cell wall biosynthesis
MSGQTTQRQICVVAPFPPPHYGQSIATAHLDARLRPATGSGPDWACFDSGGGPGPAHRVALGKLAALLGSMRWLRRNPPSVVYISVSARFGMALTWMVARAARRQGHRVVLHHHTRSHLRPGNRRMAALCQAAGLEALHLVICPDMAAMTRAACAGVRHTACFSNIGVVDLPDSLWQVKAAAATAAGGFRPRVLGHMGNLTLEKGLARALDSFRAARAMGLAERMILAGPAAAPDAAACIAAAQAEFGTALDWRGPVYGVDKKAFFADIDVFLFPSLYKDETQGIVNLEALASGTPVLAFALCCTPSDLQGPAAATVPMQADFPQAAVEFLRALPADAPQAARMRFDSLRAGHDRELTALSTYLTPPT